MSPHQVIHQVNNHHSAPNVAGPLAPQVGASNGGQDDTNANDENDHIDLIAIEDELDEELGLDDEERRTADGMLQRGMHPNAVRNKINKDRYGAVQVAMAEAQKQRRLDENEPRCKTCGTPAG